MDLRDALTQIAAIRQQVAQTETFRGYRAAPVALSGVLAWLAAALQTLVADQVTLAKLPELHRLGTALRGRHLGLLLDDLTGRNRVRHLGRQQLDQLLPSLSRSW